MITNFHASTMLTYSAPRTVNTGLKLQFFTGVKLQTSGKFF